VLPRRRVEPGEHHKDAAQREFTEEVGVTPPMEELDLLALHGKYALYRWEVEDTFHGARNREVALHAWLPLRYLPSKTPVWMDDLFAIAGLK